MDRDDQLQSVIRTMQESVNATGADEADQPVDGEANSPM
jgi:hypothetical protein